MAKKFLKKCSTSFIFREVQIKRTLRFYLTTVRVRMAKIKTQVTADVGEDVEKGEHSSTSGGIARRYNHSGNQLGSSSKTWTYFYLKIQQHHS